MNEESLKVGMPAPDFTLLDQQGKMVRISDFHGAHAVLLIFYPGDLTPGCTVQLCAIRDDWSKFQELGVEVFGINPANAESHDAFVKKMTLPFPLLVDTGKKVSKKYDAIRSLFKMQVIKRSVIGIGKDGVVRYLKRGMPKNAEILKALKPYC